jgi:hypothetical protein
MAINEKRSMAISENNSEKLVEGVGWIQPDVFAKLNPNYTPRESGSKLGEIERVVESEITDNGEIEKANGDVGLTESQEAILKVCRELTHTLLEKNRKYGNSALEPVRVFSKAPANEQIKVRLDDKISRLQSGQVDEDEDVILDLIGYLTLLLVHKRMNEIGVQTDYDC